LIKGNKKLKKNLSFAELKVLNYNNNKNNNNLLTAIGLSPGGSGYFTCIENTKLVTNKFKSGVLHEKHVVAAWNLGNHLSIWFYYIIFLCRE